MIGEMTGAESGNVKGSERENEKEREKRSASLKGRGLGSGREKKKGSGRESVKGKESEKSESVKGNESENVKGTMKERGNVNEAGIEKESVLEIGKKKIKEEKIAERKGMMCGKKEKNCMMIEKRRSDIGMKTVLAHVRPRSVVESIPQTVMPITVVMRRMRNIGF